MKNKFSAASAALALAFAAPLALAQSAPTSGAYTTDPTNSYVQDQVLQSINTVNSIMCIMTSMRPEMKVNASPYLALIDDNKCNEKGGAGETSNTGANAAVNYIKAVVKPTRSGSNPLGIHAWLTLTNDFGDVQAYADASITRGPSTSRPNGEFALRYSGYLAATPTTKVMQGNLSSNGSTLEFYEATTNPSNQAAYSTALTLTQSGTESGSGRLREDYTGSPIDATFAYNSTHFLRKSGAAGTQQCFSRSLAEADTSVWRYGVYTADGSRHDLSNPGFQVTYGTGANTYYGFASYYGIYLPSEAMTAIKLAGNTGTVSRPSTTGGTATNYTLGITGGRLTKMTKRSTTLDSIKGMPLRVWLSGATGETKIVWDGSTFQKKEIITCGQTGCGSADTTGTLSASDLRGLAMLALHGHSETLGGGFSVNVPTPTGSFSGSTTVTYRTTAVVPAATAANLTLVCVSECPGTTTEMGTPATVHKTVGTSIYNWGPVVIANAKTYVFDANGLMHFGTVATANKVDASGITLTGNNQWGVRSGTMAVSTSNAIKCDSLGGATATTHICPHLINDLAETYTWETGKNPWNWNITLTNQSTSQAVAFDAPAKLEVTLSTSNSSLPTGDTRIGAKLFLDFNGFGQLNGIPGRCYNPATNVKGPCDGVTHTMYAPDFSLKNGAEVTDGADPTKKYFIKQLDQEIRFAGKLATACNSLSSALTAASTATLPVATGTDAKTTIGANAPTLTSSAPAVIHGVVQ